MVQPAAGSKRASWLVRLEEYNGFYHLREQEDLTPLAVAEAAWTMPKAVTIQ